MYHKHLFLTLLAGLLAALAATVDLAAQETELWTDRADAPSPFELTFSGLFSGTSRLESGRTRLGRVAVNRASLSGGYRVGTESGDETGIHLGFDRYRLRLDLQTPLPRQLQRAWVGGFALRSFATDWFVFTDVGASLASNGTSLGSKGFGASGVLLVGRQWSPELRAGLGVALETLSGDVIPLLDLNWKFTERWEFVVGFPRAGLSCRVVDRGVLFVGAEGEFASFHFCPEPGRAATASIRSTQLEFQEVRAVIGYRQDFCPDLSVDLAIGSTVLRHFVFPRRGTVRELDLDARGNALAITFALTGRF